MNTKKIKVMAVGMFLIGIALTKLSFADDPPARIRPTHSAYGDYLVYPGNLGQYTITTSDGQELHPSDEVTKVPLNVYGFPTAADYIHALPIAGEFPYFQGTFQFLLPNQNIRLTDARARRFRNGSIEPMEVIPNFVRINGRFHALQVNFAGTNPGGWDYYNFIWLNRTLLQNGRDNVKFYSPYLLNGNHAILAKEYVVSADASKWAALTYVGTRSNVGPKEVVIAAPTAVPWVWERTIPISPLPPADTQVTDFHFSVDGRYVVILTNRGTIVVDTAEQP